MKDKDYEKLAKSPDQWVCSSCCGDCSLSAFNITAEAVDVFHFDFQQNLPTPKLTVGRQFYMRLLWTYLFGIYCASNNMLCAFMWNELIARRGGNDVVSALSYFLYCTRFGRTGAKHSIWWADNCKGQNKNHIVIWFFQDLIRRGIYTRIDYKFLIVGHTYGPTDRCFGVIEKHLKKIEQVYTPEEWYQHVRESAVSEHSKIEVIEMQQENFRDYRKQLKQMYTKRDKDKNGTPLEFSKAVWFNFGVGEEVVDGSLVQIEHPQEVWVRFTYSQSEIPRKVSFFKKSNICYTLQYLPPVQYDQYPLPIKSAKASDLQTLASKYLPDPVKEMYMGLPSCDATVSDDEDN